MWLFVPLFIAPTFRVADLVAYAYTRKLPNSCPSLGGWVAQLQARRLPDSYLFLAEYVVAVPVAFRSSYMAS